MYKEKGSKFIGYAYPVSSEEEIKQHIAKLKKEHYAARHWCYAWKLGVEDVRYRVNDDGEPNNSAGQPIYGQILSKDLTNVLVVVVRYFGGTKLGVGGLINAYKTAAKLILEESVIIEKIIKESVWIQFEYKDMNKVMRIIKDFQLEILSQKMELNCEYKLAVRRKNYLEVLGNLESLRCVKIKELKS